MKDIGAGRPFRGVTWSYVGIGNPQTTEVASLAWFWGVFILLERN
jgi:hypothetical protein